jgi:DNA (cytosine-5)-methyltransferase 1
VKFRILSLFAGIGGFDLGLERTGGFKTVAFCEIDPFCQKVLAKNWPHVPCYADVRELSLDRLVADGVPAPTVICGGFPCQDLSLAGRMAGISADRSGLWGEMCRLIGEIRPTYVLVENVPGLLVGERGAWFGRVLGDLAALGYDAEWHSIPASTIGAPHRRDRVWIVAYPGQEQRQDTSLRASEEGGEKCARRTPLENGDFYRLVRGISVRVANDWWRAQSDMARSCDGLPDRLDRIATLGNTVVPQIPELIGRAILASLQSERLAA